MKKIIAILLLSLLVAIGFNYAVNEVEITGEKYPDIICVQVK